MSPFLWLLIALLFLILEGMTTGLICIWFAIGAGLSWISAIFGASALIQVLLFFPGSAVIMVAFRSCLKTHEKTPEQKTNADGLIGKRAVVTEDINNMEETGEVKLEGKRWSARSSNPDCQFCVGDQVEVLEIRGVKLIVQ